MKRHALSRLLSRAAFVGVTIALLVQISPDSRRGDTLFRVRAEDLDERRAIHGQLWRVQRAIADVRAAYELDDLALEVVVDNLGGLGQTTPAVSGLAEIRGARVVLNKRLFLEEHEEIDEILLGLMAHELAHALHYARLSRPDLVELGLRYDRMISRPDGSARRSIRAYERLTDMTVIALGFGEALIHQKRASAANLALNDPPQVWDFYLTEPEIRALLADRRLLRREIEAAITDVGLPSFKRLRLDALVDADGDILPPPAAPPEDSASGPPDGSRSEPHDVRPHDPAPLRPEWQEAVAGGQPETASKLGEQQPEADRPRQALDSREPD